MHPQDDRYVNDHSGRTLPADAVAARQVTSGGRVVVADDDDALRKALSAALVRLGYAVEQAPDGNSALAAVARFEPDLVLLDVDMPGLDGFQVCRALRSEPATRLLPVVLLTGYSEREARFEGLNAGASDFLTKPFDLPELSIRVRNLVAAHRIVKDLESVEQIICSVAKAVEARDGGTGDHCERLAGLAARFGRHLGLTDHQILALGRAGFLHDFGKIGVPDAVLLKPGPLDPEEWRLMRRHPEIGAEICAPLRALREVVPVIRHHHERWNGSGYPDRLKGEEIPYLARVFQIVDAFDALTNDRCYRRALSFEAAVGMLSDEAERGLWDPGLVDRFGELMQPREQRRRQTECAHS